jgi:hypothetical protein
MEPTTNKAKTIAKTIAVAPVDWTVFAGVQVECRVLYASPQPLDERIFDPAALAVHTEAEPAADKGRGGLYTEERKKSNASGRRTTAIFASR